MNKKLIYLILIILLVAGVEIFFNFKNVVPQEENKKSDIKKILSENNVFEKYKADIYKGDYIFGELDDFYKEKIIEKGSNFAGHYYFYTSHCGTMCQENNYINLKTGEVKVLESSSMCVDYSADSNLLIIDSKECVEQFESEGIPIEIYFPFEETYYVMKKDGELVLLEDNKI